MRVKIILITVIMLACWGIGCEKDRKVKLPPHQPKLVLHGYVETGNLFEVKVGRTFSANEGTFIDATYIENALVVLYEDNVIVDTLDYDSNKKRYFSLHARAIPGKTYKAVISAAGFETIEAITPAPFPVNAESVIHQVGTGTNTSGDILDDVIFSFKDPPGVNNYYLAILKAGYNFQSFFCVYTYDPAVEKYQAGLNPFESSSCIFSDEILYNDWSFNGLTKQIVLSASSQELQPFIDQQFGHVYWPYLKRYSVTEDFYRHFKSEISLNILSNDPFASPVAIRGNVRNGYGIFTVLGTSVDTLR